MTAPAGQQAKALLNRSRGLRRMELKAPTRKNFHIKPLAWLNAQMGQEILAQGQLAFACHREAGCGQHGSPSVP